MSNWILFIILMFANYFFDLMLYSIIYSSHLIVVRTSILIDNVPSVF